MASAMKKWMKVTIPVQVRVTEPRTAASWVGRARDAALFFGEGES